MWERVLWKASACPNCGCPTEEILKELATVSTADNEVPRYEIDEKNDWYCYRKRYC